MPLQLFANLFYYNCLHNLEVIVGIDFFSACLVASVHTVVLAAPLDWVAEGQSINESLDPLDLKGI